MKSYAGELHGDRMVRYIYWWIIAFYDDRFSTNKIVNGILTKLFLSKEKCNIGIL